MDNKKIGKLIADLRKKQRLTQQELGDKVGVGFRAVSKWERGITLPDIGNMKELSKILGITLDELLAGKQKQDNEEKPKNKLSSKTKIIIILVFLTILTLTSLIIYNHNKIYAYGIKSVSKEYYAEGQVTFRGNNISIVLNNLNFKDSNFTSTIIKNYEYKITTDKEFIFGYGYDMLAENTEKEVTVKTFTEEFNINYTGKTNSKRKEILKNNITITLNFLDNNDEEITKEIEILLYKMKPKDTK